MGDGLVADLAQAYLAEVSQRLRPGSYKSVRFALELMTSHLGRHAVGDLTLNQGKEVLGYITQLSPNVRKYRDGKDAGLADLARLAQEHEGITLAPQTQARILKQMSQFLDWCVGEGELQANPWEALKVKDRPEVHPHEMLTDKQVNPARGQGQGAAQCSALRAPHRHALGRALWAHGRGHHNQGEPRALCQHQAQCGEAAQVQGS